jgi:hypothetical protein
VDRVDDEAPELLGDALDSFKADATHADELGVNDGIGGRPRLTWNPVTDTGGASAPTEGDAPAASSFRFDLGGALARLVSDDDSDDSDDSAPSPPPESQSPATSPSDGVTARPIEPRIEAATPTPTPKPTAAPGPSLSTPPPVAPPTTVAPAPAPNASSAPPEPVAPPRPEPALHELIAHRPTERNVFGDQSLPSRSDARVTPTADSVVPPPPVTRPGVERNLFADRVAPSPATSMPVTPTTPPTLDPTPVPIIDSARQPTTRPGSPPAEYPRRVPGAILESQLRRDPEPADVPEIRPATPVDDPPRPLGRVSVFDDISGTGTPTLPSPPMVGGAGAPVVSESMAPDLGGAGIPTLPAASPVASPSVAVAQSSAPSTNDITALRSAQARGGRQLQRGRVFGRSLLAFVVIGGLLGASLVFGRSLLFTTEWDAQLTPIVNEIQESRGADFDHAVALVVLPAAEFGGHLRATTIGDAWLDRVPEWRALGLTTGAPTGESVGTALAASTTATYDADSDTLYQIENADPTLARGDLRIALEMAFRHQRGSAATDATETDATETDATEITAEITVPGFTGVSSSMTIAAMAVDEALASGGVASERRPADELLPMPIAYEFAAIQILGEPLLQAAGVDPATLTVGGTHPAAIVDLLGDGPVSATSDILRPGDISLTNPVALGNDDWSLVWGARLPESTVGHLVGQVTADSYRVIERSGTVCVAGVFQTASAVDGSAVFAAMLTWAAQSPPAAQATATALGPTRILIEACDPGPGGGLAANHGVVDALIDRQQARLTN